MAIIKVPMDQRLRFNSTTPPGELGDFVTPNEKLFIVYHLGLPAIDGLVWSLAIDGLVERPMTLTLADLASLPAVEVCTVHECAGSPLKPTVPVRRVANVVWKGVRLKTVLDMAGIQPEARFVWSRGADSGIYPPTGTNNDCYLKDMPIDKVDDDNVLLATEVNGVPLSVGHGAPLRLVVPGYYGTNSVKWLTEIRLERTRAPGFFTTTLYNDRCIENGIERTKPVWALAPNSIIVEPVSEEILGCGPLRIRGWAWSENAVRQVDISLDGGASWHCAQLESGTTGAWQRFWLDWTPACAGLYQIISRATDSAGNSQPAHGARNAVFKATVRIGS